MDLSHILLLLVAGVAAGTVNAIAGGGSLITFPTLIATGLPSVEANVTNSVSVFPGYVSSVLGSRADLVGQGARVRAILPTSVVGSVSWAEAMGLVVARVEGESKGFIINRVWRAVKREALRVVDEGHADPADVDRLWMLEHWLANGDWTKRGQAQT